MASLHCGCSAVCCGICTHAKAAGRTRENVADFNPPDLNKLRGEKWRAQRDADDGEPVMWADVGVAAVVDYIAARRAELARHDASHAPAGRSWRRGSTEKV